MSVFFFFLTVGFLFFSSIVGREGFLHSEEIPLRWRFCLCLSLPAVFVCLSLLLPFFISSSPFPPFLRLSVCLSVCLCLFLSQAVCLPVCLSRPLSLSFCLPASLSVFQPVCLSSSPFFFFSSCEPLLSTHTHTLSLRSLCLLLLLSLSLCLSPCLLLLFLCLCLSLSL